MNSVFKSHAISASNRNQCVDLSLSVVKETKLGLAWKYQFRCQNCTFLSSVYKLYEEIANTHSAAINTQFVTGIMDTPLGIQRARLFLTSLDIPPPSRSYLQKLTDKTSTRIVQLNKEDMQHKLELVRQHKALKGSQNPKHIHVSMDTRYNANRMKSSYKPGQSSSQAYTVAIENETDQQYIIALAIENKLCWVGAWMKNRGYDVQCPGGHAECTADIPHLQPHSREAACISKLQKICL